MQSSYNDELYHFMERNVEMQLFGDSPNLVFNFLAAFKHEQMLFYRVRNSCKCTYNLICGRVAICKLVKIFHQTNIFKANSSEGLPFPHTCNAD